MLGNEIKVLDGGIATQLQAEGVQLCDPWLTSEPLRTDGGRSLVEVIHCAYLEAGSKLLTANTFRTNERVLARIGLAADERAMFVDRAVRCAKSAKESLSSSALIAGSVAPVEDCYSPDRTPPDGELLKEHKWMAEQLAGAGVDIALVETQCTLREAVIAVDAAQAAGLRPWASFVVDKEARLLDGSSLSVAARAVADSGAEAVMVNCVPPEVVPSALTFLADAGLPMGAAPNLEDRSGLGEWQHSAHHLSSRFGAEILAELVTQWRADHDLELVGGCCGSSPAQIGALSESLNSASRRLP